MIIYNFLWVISYNVFCVIIYNLAGVIIYNLFGVIIYYFLNNYFLRKAIRCTTVFYNLRRGARCKGVEAGKSIRIVI